MDSSGDGDGPSGGRTPRFTICHCNTRTHAQDSERKRRRELAHLFERARSPPREGTLPFQRARCLYFYPNPTGKFIPAQPVNTSSSGHDRCGLSTPRSYPFSKSWLALTVAGARQHQQSRPRARTPLVIVSKCNLKACRSVVRFVSRRPQEPQEATIFLDLHLSALSSAS